MRINLAYGAMLGILAASFGVLGSAPAQAGAVAGTTVTTAAHHAVSADRTVQRSDRCGWGGDGCCWNRCCWGGGWGWGDRCDFDHFDHHHHHHHFRDFDHFDHFRDFDHGGFEHGGFDHGGFEHGGFDHGGFEHGGFGHGHFR